MKKYHLITGLPRSGTTLLSAILNQNPKFESSIANPIAGIVKSIITESNAQGGYRIECPPEKQKQLIKSVFDTYYDNPIKEVAFNNNRGWGLQLSMMKDLYPELKVIMCVRDLGWILDSFETLARKNPYSMSAIFTVEENLSVYTRCEALMKGGRPVGFAYNALKQALSGEHKNSILVLEYDYFVKNPEISMRAIYQFINEPYFKHNFNNVATTHDEFDKEVGLPGLHTTRKKVEFIQRETILPQDVWDNCKGMEIWKK